MTALILPLLSLPFVSISFPAKFMMPPSPSAAREAFLLILIPSAPETVMAPPGASMLPLIDVVPMLSTSMRPPPMALREGLLSMILPMVVALEVTVGGAEVPLKMPPTTMRCAGVVGGVEDAGAVAVTVVAPRTVLMPWGVLGSAEPEKI